MLTKYFFRRGSPDDPATRGRFTRLARILRTRPSAIDPLRTMERPGADFETAWRPRLKARVLVVLAFVAVWVAGIEARLVQLQVFQHKALLAQATRQQEQAVHPEALRGDIVDRNGAMLAYSVDAESIAADPSLVKDPAATADALCDALGDCSAADRTDLADRLSGDSRFTYVRRSRAVSPEQVARVAALKLPGIVTPADTRRYYPRYELAAHILGFVDQDNRGQAGIEYVLDKTVHGEDGLAYVEVDAKRHRLNSRVERAPVPGATVELTIDLNLQYIAERELRAGVEANHAAGGTAVIMDPTTGEILALASYPTFNPNAAGRATDEAREDRAIQEVYEPGSTFKMITAAAALSENVVKPTDLIDTSPGYISFPGRKPIRDAEAHASVLSFEDVVVQSSNIGAIKVGLRVGAERFTRYIERFGFGQALAQDFPGESAGIFRPQDLNDSGLASVSMGYQISVTPIQMVTAASSIANGGLLMEPHIVRAVVRDGRREEIAPKVLRRTITPDVAATLTTMLEGVVQRGTAKAAQMDGYEVAGKTGTAHKLVGHHYSETEYNASFVGFVPSRQPALAILVLIDSPHGGSYYGGSVSAPIFKNIAQAALQRLGVPPTINPVPPVVLADDPLAVLAAARRPPVVMPALTPVGGPALMPDVRGLDARDALRVLGGVGLSVREDGSGLVTDQSPAPGSPVEPGGWGVLHLALTAPVDANGAADDAP